MWGPFKTLFGPPTQDRFAQIVMGHLKKSGEARELTYNPEKFCIQIGGGDKQHRIFLHNLFQTYVRADRKQKAALLQAVAALRQDSSRPTEPWELVRAKLLPHVRERFYHETLSLMAQAEGGAVTDPIPTRPFADGLVIELVVDEPQTLRLVNNKQLKEWGIDFDAALVIARENLWKISNRDFALHDPGFFISPSSDTHDASRMFLHDLIWQLPVKGDHVVMIPNRNSLMVTGSDDEEALMAMGKITEELLRGERPMTGMAYRLDGTRWVPFLPPSASRAFAPMKSCAFLSNLQWHAEQHDWLEQICKKRKEDSFVPKLIGMKRDTGELYTWTSWVEEVTHALMPKADIVALGLRPKPGEKYRAMYGDWDRVFNVAGHLLKPTEHYPVRYVSSVFPTPEQLKEMNLRDAP
jgi:hypothetical protein